MPTETLFDKRSSWKSLERAEMRSLSTLRWHRATFHREVLPRIRKLAQICWRDAITTTDARLKLMLMREYRELTEFRRSLIGFAPRLVGPQNGQTEMRRAPAIFDVASAASAANASSPIDRQPEPSARVETAANAVAPSPAAPAQPSDLQSPS